VAKINLQKPTAKKESLNIEIAFKRDKKYFDYR
jgi:hypothetical protein